MYSVIIHKSTRKPFVAVSDLNLASAKEQAEKLYDAGKLFSGHGTLVSGVCVVVLPNEVIISDLSNMDVRQHALHQCGSF